MTTTRAWLFGELEKPPTLPEPGDRVRAVRWMPSVIIDDNVTVPPGTEGSVTLVSSTGVSVRWDNGRTLSLLPGDEWENIPRRQAVPDGEFYISHGFTVGTKMLTFRWHGGAYIDVSYRGRVVEVINVWDDEHDQPLIPRTQEAFMERIEGWLEEYDLNDLEDL